MVKKQKDSLRKVVQVGKSLAISLPSLEFPIEKGEYLRVTLEDNNSKVVITKISPEEQEELRHKSEKERIAREKRAKEKEIYKLIRELSNDDDDELLAQIKKIKNKTKEL